MSDYTIYCTEAQTKKALELGAPIFTFSESFADGYRTSFRDKYCSIPPIKEEDYEDDVYADIPTAEQMIGWLRDKDVHVSTPIGWGSSVNAVVTIISTLNIIASLNRKTPKEATLAAIDAALDYLSKTDNK